MASEVSTGASPGLVLDPQLQARIERLAEAAGRSASELVGSVLRAFLDENERALAAIDAGIEEADAGVLLAYDDVKAEPLARLQDAPPRR